MTWGNPIPAQATTVAVVCDHPQCNERAVVLIDMNGEKVKSCVAHSDGFNIVGIVEGAQIVEGITKRLIAQWDAAKLVLEAAKNSEMEARLLVGNYAFPVAGRKEGVNNAELSDGRVVKLGHKVNYKLTGGNEAIEKAEDEAEKAGNEGAFLVERIISWEAKFSVGEYKKLDPANPTHAKVKAAIDKVLEISNGTPSLEIKEPKAKLNNQ